MKLIIDIDDELYKRICEAQSVPDMCGTDVVNAINRIKEGTICNQIATELQPNCNNLQQTQGDLISRDALKAYARKVICGNNPTNTLIIRMFDEIIDNAPAEVD